MDTTASQRLIKLVPRKDPSWPGISHEDTARIQVDEKVRTDILSCLYDVNPSEVGWGLWFCESLLAAGKLDSRIKEALIQQVPSLLKCEDAKIKSDVLPLVIRLRGELPEYRNLLLQCLQDSSPVVRKLALLNSETFLNSREIEPLLAFNGQPFGLCLAKRGARTNRKKYRKNL